MYSVKTRSRFDKEFKKLDKFTQQILSGWIEKNLISNRSGQWRYRIGDYRLICTIEDETLVILALALGHRRDIYKR